MRIDDLRTTLTEHADLAHDEGLADRAGAVRGRVRTVPAVAAPPSRWPAWPAPCWPCRPSRRSRSPRPSPPPTAPAGRTAPETSSCPTASPSEFHRARGHGRRAAHLRLDRSKEPRLDQLDGRRREAEGRLRRPARLEPSRAPGPPAGPASRPSSTSPRAPGRPTASPAPASPTPTPAPRGGWRWPSTPSPTMPPMASAPTTSPSATRSTAPSCWARPSGSRGRRACRSTSSCRRRCCACPGSAWRRAYVVRTEIEGQRGYTATTCGLEPDRDPAPSWTGVQLAGTKKADGTRFRAGETLEVTISIHPDERGRTQPVSVPVAFVWGGAYADDPGAPVGPTGTTVDRLVERSGHPGR